MAGYMEATKHKINGEDCGGRQKHMNKGLTMNLKKFFYSQSNSGYNVQKQF